VLAVTEQGIRNGIFFSGMIGIFDKIFDGLE
jgi:hypothetical protein